MKEQRLSILASGSEMEIVFLFLIYWELHNNQDDMQTVFIYDDGRGMELEEHIYENRRHRDVVFGGALFAQPLA